MKGAFMKILSMDTSSDVCSVALLEDDRINKIEKKDSNEDSFRDRVLDKLVERYEKLVD